jgi:hypothetical protein
MERVNEFRAQKFNIMNREELASTAKALVASGKGLSKFLLL